MVKSDGWPGYVLQFQRGVAELRRKKASGQPGLWRVFLFGPFLLQISQCFFFASAMSREQDFWEVQKGQAAGALSPTLRAVFKWLSEESARQRREGGAFGIWAAAFRLEILFNCAAFRRLTICVAAHFWPCWCCVCLPIIAVLLVL